MVRFPVIVGDGHFHLWRGQGDVSDRIGGISFVNLLQVLAADRLEIVSPEKDRVLIPAQFDTRADESVMSLAVLGF